MIWSTGHAGLHRSGSSKRRPHPAVGRRPPSALLLLRRSGQERADSALRLAARRHGRPDARLRAHPCGDDGHRRRLHDRAHRPLWHWLCPPAKWPPGSAHLTALLAATIALVQTTSRRSWPIPPCRSLATWCGRGCGRLRRGHLPPGDPRLLQGAALPGRRQRDARHRRHSRHQPAGRAAHEDAGHLPHLPDRRGWRWRAFRCSPASSPRTPSWWPPWTRTWPSTLSAR
jgi:hypothetical protein